MAIGVGKRAGGAVHRAPEPSGLDWDSLQFSEFLSRTGLSRAITVTPPCLDGFVSGFAELLDELRCWETERLQRERVRVVREKRRLEARELALTKVLDERRAVPHDQGVRDGESDATAKRKLETARKLANLPHLGDAALDGQLSSEQLHPAADLADENSDEEWSQRAAKASPTDLQRMARKRRAMSREDSVRRRERRSLRKWRDDHGFLHGRFELPLEHGGAEVEAFFDQVAEKMRPAKGQAWDSLEHRHADTLIGLCRLDAPVDGRDEEDRAQVPTMAARPMVVVDVPLNGPATLCGIPLPDEWVEAWRAELNVQLRAVDEHGMPVADGPIRKFVSDKRRRAVLRRDGHCRWPGCNRRLRLQVHHLQPSSWGGGDDVANLAAVCPAHHALLVPHGDLLLEGNPNQPDGLSLRRITAEERRRQRQRAPSAA